MSSLTKRDVVKILFESGLIVFSVLLALFLNEYRSQLKENRLKETALKKVTGEIQTNLETVRVWFPYHQSVLENLQLLDDTAWQAFKSSSIFSNIQFETMLSLSKIYNLQNSGVESTLEVILNILSSRDSLEQENLDITLLLLRNGFNELVSQEHFLIKHYEMTLAQMNPVGS